ncbi:MAG TPA: tetratricopeptide repeat protein [Flavobacteriales bacterium]|nr:tetratricopeptide repeat protein [Flavobacteriales bacterium]
MEDAHLRRALLLLRHARPAEAEKELRAQLEVVPDDTQALLLLSHALSEQDKHKEAVAIAREAVAAAPDLDSAHYHLARALFGQRDLAEARRSAEEAVTLDPGDADNHGLLALILHHASAHEEALAAAERGLAIDPEHLGCLNVRSAELTHLKRHEEADSTIGKALELDPENPYTHSNTGWTALRRGDQARAMEHFREALRREPGLESARAGMVEALKSRYWIYRQWLKYVFWVGNLKPGVQQGLIIGAWILMRVLRSVADAVPALGILIWPLLIAYVVFALSTWVIEPLTNLLLRSNRFGRFLLRPDERITSTLTGISLVVAIAGGVLLITTDDERWVATGLFGLLMMIPLASMLREGKGRTVRVAAAVGLALCGIAGCVLAAASGEALNIPFVIFAIGAILYQWIVALSAR